MHAIGFSRQCDQNLLEQMRGLGQENGVFRYAEMEDDDDALCSKVMDVFEVGGRSGTVPIEVRLGRLDDNKPTTHKVRLPIGSDKCGSIKLWWKLPRTVFAGPPCARTLAAVLRDLVEIRTPPEVAGGFVPQRNAAISSNADNVQRLPLQLTNVEHIFGPDYEPDLLPATVSVQSVGPTAAAPSSSPAGDLSRTHSSRPYSQQSFRDEEWRLRTLGNWVARCFDELAAELLDVTTSSNNEDKRLIKSSEKLRTLYGALFRNRMGALKSETDFLRTAGKTLAETKLPCSPRTDSEEAGATGSAGAVLLVTALSTGSNADDPLALGLRALETTFEQLESQILAFQTGSEVSSGRLGDLRFASKFAFRKSLGPKGKEPPPQEEIRTHLAEDFAGRKELYVAPTFESPLKQYSRSTTFARGRTELMAAIVGHTTKHILPEKVRELVVAAPVEGLITLLCEADLDGNHSLHLGAVCGHAEIVRFLLETASQKLGGSVVANILKKENLFGETCVSIAIKSRGFHETLDILLAHGGVIPKTRKIPLVRYCFDNGYRRTGEILLGMPDEDSCAKCLDDPANYRVDETMSKHYIEVVFRRAQGRLKELFDERFSNVSAAVPEEIENFFQTLPMDWLSLLDVALHHKMERIINAILTGRVLADSVLDGGRESNYQSAFQSFLSTRTLESEIAPIVAARCFPKKPDAPDTETVYLPLFQKLFQQFPDLLNCTVKNAVAPGEDDTMLITAVKRGSHPHVCYLLDQNANLEHVNWKGTTALGVAAFLGFPCIVQELLMRGADVNHRNFHHHTPLRACCFKGSSLGLKSSSRAGVPKVFGSGHLKCAEELIAFGADVAGSSSDDASETTITTACRNGAALVLHHFLQYVNLDHCLRKAEIDGFSAVMAAAEQDRAECIEVLYNEYGGVERDGVVNVILEQKTDAANEILGGATALHIAAYYGRKVAAETLVRLEADVNAVDVSG